MSKAIALSGKMGKVTVYACFVAFLLGIVTVSSDFVRAATTEPMVVKVFTYAKKNGKVKAWTGTGFPINDSGYIVTNHHVIKGGQVFYVLPDGRRKGPLQSEEEINVERVVWSSADLDLAVIKIKEDHLKELHLKPATLASEPQTKGRGVTAIGFPGIADVANAASEDMEADSTVTRGEVGRLIKDGAFGDGRSIRLVQHNADIHGGNSGGPLVDQCGRVIGVNTVGAKAPIVRGGKLVGTQSVNYYYASDVRELIESLDSAGVEFTVDNAHCLSPAEKQQQLLQRALIIGAVGFLLLALLIFVAMRNGTARQKLSPIVEPLSRSFGRGRHRKTGTETVVDRDVGGRDSSDRHRSNEPGGSVILDGYGDHSTRLIIPSSDLARGDVVVGREPPDRRFTVDDPHKSVSRQHCVLTLQGEHLYVSDLGSANGTTLDGRSLVGTGRKEVKNGSDLKLGSLSFKVIAN